MSFLTDLFKGNFSNLGTDITHAPSSLASHPDELAETLGGAALAATGGLGLAGIGPLAGVFGGADVAGGSALSFADAAGTDAASIFPAASGDVVPLAGSAGDLGGAETTGLAAFGGAPGTSLAPSGSNLLASLGGNASTSGLPSWLTSLGTGAAKEVTSNPLGIAAAGAGLGYELLRGSNPTGQYGADIKSIESAATQFQQQGGQLQSYLANGTLPPALQAQLTQATAAAKARLVANAAASGQSTDPTQNSVLAQDLNNVDLQAIAQMGQVEQQLLQTGINESGLSSQLYEALVGIDQKNNTDLMNAISSFAASLSGGMHTGGGTTITLPTGSKAS